MTKKNVHTLVLFCKSYKGDLKACERLIKTFNAHNADNLVLYISVPESDMNVFLHLTSETIELISDESYAGEYLTDASYWGLSSGYVNQEICKLSFWEIGLADNYFCVDSDAYFIRNFSKTDFLSKDNYPYSVLIMDKDLNVEKYYREFGKWRKEMISKIFEYVGLSDQRMLTCHGMTVLNTTVLKSMKTDLLQKNNLQYKNLIEISPYEYTWYNAWLQKSKVIPILPVEPFFKTYHMRLEYTFSRLRLIREEDLAEEYIGIVLNSNWQAKHALTRYEPPTRLHQIIYNAIERLG